MDVHGLSVQLFRRADQAYSTLPDRWAVSGDTQGRDICGVAHGFVIELLDEHNERRHSEGVRIDIEVVDHWSTPGYRDLWDQTAPNGKKYGFLRVFPDAGSGVFDGVLHGRTNPAGSLDIYAGLGDPEGTFDSNAPLDLGYEWPVPGSSSSEWVDTFVQLKISIPGKGPPLQPIYVWCRYVRVQYQNFWWPEGQGVYNYSIQGIGKLTFGSNVIQSDDPNTIDQSVTMPDLTLYDSMSPKPAPSNCPRVTPATKRSAMTYITSSGVSLDSLDLAQLRWDPDIGWAYYLVGYGEGLPGHWIAEPNDPNDIIEMLSVSQPYAFWADVTVTEPFHGDTATTTVILRAMDRVNVVQSKIPLAMTLVEKSPDNLTLTFLSDWFIVSVDPNFHGYYQDQWQNPYTVIYMPEQTHPDLDFPEIFGDFNADDKVDFCDFALYADHWQDSIEDPNTNYDAMYEEPNNWDGQISMPEVGAFAENWLWQAGEAMMMDHGMTKGMNQSLGLTERIDQTAPAEQQPGEIEPLD
ncbi:MAG: hypothetical protein WBC22_20410 [Sedimentisphaerales bacterium]